MPPRKAKVYLFATTTLVADVLMDEALAEVTLIGSRAKKVADRVTLASLANRYTAGGGPNPATPARIHADSEAFMRVARDHVVSSATTTWRQIIADTQPALGATKEARTKALFEALDKAAAEGLTAYVDRSGKKWAPDTYAALAHRAALAETAMQAAVEGAEHGYVVVSVIGDACPSCRVYEGTLLATTTEGLSGRPGMWRVPGTVGSACAAGFGHIGCRHTLTPWTPDMTRPPRTVRLDPTAYAHKQRTNDLVRRVRGNQRRTAVTQAPAHPNRKPAPSTA